MGRYERVNLLTQYRATSFQTGRAQVQEWEVRYFDPTTGAANMARFTSKRDALKDIERESQRGRTCEGPFLALRA